MKKIMVVSAALLLLSVFSIGVSTAKESSKGSSGEDPRYEALYEEYEKTLQMYYQEKQRRIRAEGRCFAEDVKGANKKLDKFRPEGKEKKVKGKGKVKKSKTKQTVDRP